MKKNTSEEKIATILIRKKKTLAIAESCTGGLAASRITDVAGSSRFFFGGVVAYSNKVKIDSLRVPELVIKKEGAVSRAVAKAMSEGAREVFSSSIAASITGIAGPAGGSAKKPVGLAYISVASNKGTTVRKVLFKGTREDLKKQFSDALLKLIEKNI
jgi:nicotinamide-nucleotide amidase